MTGSSLMSDTVNAPGLLGLDSVFLGVLNAISHAPLETYSRPTRSEWILNKISRELVFTLKFEKQ